MIIIERADNTAAISTHISANRLPERPVNTSFDARRVNLHADFSVFLTPEWKSVRILKTQLFPHLCIYLYSNDPFGEKLDSFVPRSRAFQQIKQYLCNFGMLFEFRARATPQPGRELTLESDVFKNDRMLARVFRSLKRRLKIYRS